MSYDVLKHLINRRCCSPRQRERQAWYLSECDQMIGASADRFPSSEDSNDCISFSSSSSFSRQCVAHFGSPATLSTPGKREHARTGDRKSRQTTPTALSHQRMPHSTNNRSASDDAKDKGSFFDCLSLSSSERYYLCHQSRYLRCFILADLSSFRSNPITS